MKVQFSRSVVLLNQFTLPVAPALALVFETRDLSLHFSRRSAAGALVGPTADAVHLLLHRARERHDLRGDRDQVRGGEVALLELGSGDRGDHTLLALGAAPAARETLQAFEVELGGIVSG